MSACRPYLVTKHPMFSLARFQVLFRKGHQRVPPLLAPERGPELLGAGGASFQRRGWRVPDPCSSGQAFQAETEHSTGVPSPRQVSGGEGHKTPLVASPSYAVSVPPIKAVSQGRAQRRTAPLSLSGGVCEREYCMWTCFPHSTVQILDHLRSCPQILFNSSYRQVIVNLVFTCFPLLFAGT